MILDIATLKELHDLKDTKVYDYLREQFSQYTISQASIRDDVTLRWMQGKSQLLMEIIALIDRAPDEIEKIKSSKKEVQGMF